MQKGQLKEGGNSVGVRATADTDVITEKRNAVRDDK